MSICMSCMSHKQWVISTINKELHIIISEEISILNCVDLKTDEEISKVRNFYRDLGTIAKGKRYSYSRGCMFLVL